MNDLLKLAVEAHGGLENWNKFTKLKAHMLLSGVLLSIKGHAKTISESTMEIELQTQRCRYLDFDNRSGQEAIFEPNKVSIIDNGQIKELLLKPRDSFKGQVFETLWTEPQLVYVSMYAMWGYMTIPFNVTLPGFKSEEIEPWHEAGELWRCLRVTFPDHLAYHSKVQVFFFDEKGMLKRMNYVVDVNEKIKCAHYAFDYKEFQGIKLPTRRMIYACDENGHYIRKPLVVGNQVLDIVFS